MASAKLSSFHLDTEVIELAALEDIAQELLEHTSKNMDPGSAQAFRNRCSSYIADGELQKLVNTFVQAIEMVAEASPVEDTEARFSILFSLARHLPPEAMTTISTAVANLPFKTGDELAKDHKMRMHVMRNLYTVIAAKSPIRFEILKAMLEYGKNHNVFAVLDGTTANDVEELCNMWFPVSVNPEAGLVHKRELYMKLCDMSKQKQERSESAAPEDIKSELLKEHRLLGKLLDTYETSPELLTESDPYAARAAFIAIKFPLPGDMAVSNSLEEHSLDGLKRSAIAVLTAEKGTEVNHAELTASASSIAHYAALKHISAVPEYSKLYELLTIFAGKGLEEYQTFANANASYIESVGLDAKECEENIRLLTLAQLASGAEEVAYSDIAQKLHVSDDQVEVWIIKAIESKLIEGKIDQLNSKVVINRGSQRLLTEEQWGEVQDKLGKWTSSVRGLLSTIKKVRQEQDSIIQQATMAKQQQQQQQEQQQEASHAQQQPVMPQH